MHHGEGRILLVECRVDIVDASHQRGYLLAPYVLDAFHAGCESHGIAYERTSRLNEQLGLMLAPAEMLGYGGRGFLGIFLVGGYVHAELCFQRVLHLAKESAAKVNMVGQFRAEFVGQSANTFGTWLPGLAPSGCEVAVESGNADVAYAVQMCHQFAEFLFLHIESETRQGAVVDLEIAPQSNIDGHVGMLCSQFCDDGHFHIVV